MKLYGLTGGIACGKSTVSSLLAKEHGAVIVDTDAIVHELQVPGSSAVRAIARAFPDVVSADGVLDRGKLGTLVFESRAARRRLAGIMNWRVVVEIFRRLAVLWLTKPSSTVVVLDAPLLYETGLFTHIVSAVVAVGCSRDVQISRMAARNGYSREEAEARIAAQMPAEDKMRRAAYAIDNGHASLDELAARVREVHGCLRTRSTALSGWNRFVVAVGAAAVVLVWGTVRLARSATGA